MDTSLSCCPQSTQSRFSLHSSISALLVLGALLPLLNSSFSLVGAGSLPGHSSFSRVGSGQYDARKGFLGTKLCENLAFSSEVVRGTLRRTSLGFKTGPLKIRSGSPRHVRYVPLMMLLRVKEDGIILEVPPPLFRLSRFIPPGQVLAPSCCLFVSITPK